MRIMTDSDVLAHFAEVLDAVVDDREPVVITRAGRPRAVIMALDDWEAMKETVRTPLRRVT